MARQDSEAVTCGTRLVLSYKLEGEPSIVLPPPFSTLGLLCVGDKVRSVFALKPNASGGITLKPGEKNTAFIA